MLVFADFLFMHVANETFLITYGIMDYHSLNKVIP